jgi:AAA15 family ATPase/GTPase
MFLKNIEIQNFRSISNLKIEDLGQINIFTGENNTGKTTVLEAIFQLLGWRVGVLNKLNSFRNLSKEVDISYFFNNLNTSEPITIQAQFELEEYERRLEISYTKTTKSWDEEVEKITSILTEKSISFNPEHSENTVDLSTGQADSKDQENVVYPLKVLFPNFKVFEHSNLIKKLSEIIGNKEQSKIINLLKPIDDRIQNIVVNGNGIFLDLEGVPKLMPIELSGDGLRRILSLILSIYDAGQNGFVMIDEIENGLHFSTLPKFWKCLLLTAKEMNVQLFLTTHNEEILRAFNDLIETEFKDFQPKVMYYNLKKYDNDELYAYKYDFEKLGYLLTNGNEIR